MTSRMPTQKMSALLQEVRSLSENGLNESAILLGSLLISLFEEGFPRACARTVLGHALKTDGQYKRALQMYQDALHELNRLRGSLPTEAVHLMSDDGDVTMGDEDLAQQQSVGENASFWTMATASGMSENISSQHEASRAMDETPLTGESPGDKKRRRRSTSPQSPIASLLRFSANIKFRMAQCHVSLGQEEAAISVLEGIPREDISGSGLALLGRLKRRAGSKGGLPLLKESLSKEPFALEVILTLLEMETDAEEIISLLTLHGRRKLSDWMEQLIRAHASAYKHQPREAINRFAQLSSKVFPSNSHVLTSLAKLELDSGNREAALSLFARARAVDPLALENSDVYAELLRSVPDRTKLVQLTHELLNSGGRSRPEPWVSAGLLSDLRGDKDKALAYVNRATELDPLHVPALHLKGSLLLQARRPMESLSTYARALSIRRDLQGLKGLVDAYLGMHPAKVKDAVAIAEEAIKLMPKDPRPLLLMGKALAAWPSYEKLAVDFLFRAMKHDPTNPNVAACSMIADIRAAQFRRGEVGRDALLEVAGMLGKCVHARGLTMTRDQLYCKIGTLYAFAGDRCRALENFHDALSINAQSTEAKDALEMLERIEPPLSEQRPRRAASAYNNHPQISPSRRSPTARLPSSTTPVSPEARGAAAATMASALSPQARRRIGGGAPVTAGTGTRRGPMG